MIKKKTCFRFINRIGRIGTIWIELHNSGNVNRMGCHPVYFLKKIKNENRMTLSSALQFFSICKLDEVSSCLHFKKNINRMTVVWFIPNPSLTSPFTVDYHSKPQINHPYLQYHLQIPQKHQ